MRILVVTPYPPTRDGIAAYALQQVYALRHAGHDVEVLSPGPSAAHHHLDLLDARAGFALAKRVRDYDRVIVQFHPNYFYPQPSTPSQRARVSATLAVAFRAARDLEVYVHEIDYRYGRGRGPDALATRAMWRAVDRVYVHTDTERDDFMRAFGLRRDHVLVAQHGQDFTRRTFHSRASARETLGIEPGVFSFLSIGFIQPHKGFDRAVRAFAGLAARGCRYDVVGSVRVEEPEYAAYRAELEGLVHSTPGAHLHSGFVSDELFDRWLVAADAVVLPYREIWSSSVLERAALYDVPVIATAVGGLVEQAGQRPGVLLVADDGELRSVMWRMSGAGVTRLPAQAPWPTDRAGLRDDVQAEVRARAVAHRGGQVARGASGLAVAASTAMSAPVRRLPPLVLPGPVSARPGASIAKRLIRRLTAWQIEPVVGQLNALRSATVESIERVGAGQSDGTPDTGAVQAGSVVDPPTEAPRHGGAPTS